jgi:hypothetical protein
MPGRISEGGGRRKLALISEPRGNAPAQRFSISDLSKAGKTT